MKAETIDTTLPAAMARQQMSRRSGPLLPPSIWMVSPNRTAISSGPLVY